MEKRNQRSSYESDGDYRYPGLVIYARSHGGLCPVGQWRSRECDGREIHVVQEMSRGRDVIDNVVGYCRDHVHDFWRRHDVEGARRTLDVYSNHLVEERFQNLRVSQRKGRESDLISVRRFPGCR